MKMNVLHMVRNRVGTIKIMLNRRNNEMTNVKIRKKKFKKKSKNKNRHVTTQVQINLRVPRIASLFQITLQETKLIFAIIKIAKYRKFVIELNIPQSDF